MTISTLQSRACGGPNFTTVRYDTVLCHFP